MKKKSKITSINEINESIAVNVTKVFGTMWITYVFFLYGFLPITFPEYMTNFMYWSGTVQLWALPLLMVGQTVLGRATEKRAQQDHETLMNQFKELKHMHEEQHDEMVELKSIAKSQAEIIVYLKYIIESNEKDLK